MPHKLQRGAFKRHAKKDPPERPLRPKVRRSRAYRKVPGLRRPMTVGESLRRRA